MAGETKILSKRGIEMFLGEGFDEDLRGCPLFEAVSERNVGANQDDSPKEKLQECLSGCRRRDCLLLVDSWLFWGVAKE